jgi:hypothetical protein
MADLSPAAQAVLDAFGTYPLRADHIDEADLRDRVVTDCEMLAAALRAAADQLSYCLDGSAYFVVALGDLLAIAAELEGAQ